MSEDISRIIIEFILNYWIYSSLFIGITLLALKKKWINADAQGEWVARSAIFLGLFTALLFVSDWRLLKANSTVNPNSVQKPSLLQQDKPNISAPIKPSSIKSDLHTQLSRLSENTKLKASPLSSAYDGWQLDYRWQKRIIFTWLTLTLSLITFKLLRFWQLKRLLSRRNKVTEAHVLTIYHRLRKNVLNAEKVDLLQADCIHSPILLSHNEIVVPDNFSALFDTEHIQAALAHELAHKHRNDLVWRKIYLLISSVFFFQPLNFILSNKLYDIAEQQSDRLASQWTGNSKALAETLALNASNLFNYSQTQWITAMHSKQSQLLTRVERLLGVNQSKSTPTYTVIAALFCFMMLTTLPGISIHNAKARSQNQSNSSQMVINDGDQDISINNSHNGHKTQIKASLKGPILFSEDESRITDFPADSYLDIKIKKRGSDEHRLRIERKGNGTVSYNYYIGGQQLSYDDAARKWFARSLPHLFRVTGFDAKKRVIRIINKGGIPALVKELELITSDFVQAKYLKYLFMQQQLSNSDASEVLSTTTELSSDFEMASMLKIFVSSQQMNNDKWRLVFDTSKSISSDFEMAGFLKDSIHKANASFDSKVQAYFFAAANSISSDFEMRNLFSAVLNSAAVENDFLLQMFKACEHISSDFELAELLGQASQLASKNDAVFDAYLDAATGISSDFEMARTLTRLSDTIDSQIQLTKLVKLAIKEIGSDFELSNFLQRVINKHPLTDELKASIYSAADDMSDFEGNKIFRMLRKASV